MTKKTSGDSQITVDAPITDTERLAGEQKDRRRAIWRALGRVAVTPERAVALWSRGFLVVRMEDAADILAQVSADPNGNEDSVRLTTQSNEYRVGMVLRRAEGCCP
jgi:hypothetical protein